MAMYGGVQSVLGRARALEESDRELALLRAVLDEIPDPIFLKDREARMRMANRAALDVIGKPPEQIMGRTVSEYFDDLQAGLALLSSDLRVIDTEEIESAEQILPGPAGTRVFLTTRSPFRDDEGNVIGVIGISRDITERKAAEMAVRENADRLALILEATSGGFWDWNIQTGDAVFSPRYATMLGYDPQEFARNYKSWKDLVHPDDVERVKQHHTDHFAGRTDFSIEFRMKAKSGNWHWVHSRGLVIERDSDGKPLRMVGTHSDIQSRKRAEEDRERLQAQLAHAQKMECVGRLAGGIAHDFGNLMSVILLHADSALEALNSSEPAHDSVTAILDAAQNAVALTRQLLAFSHKEQGKSELLDFNSVLAGCEKLVRPLMGEDIDLVFHPGESLPAVEVDPGQLYQIIMNLAVNARDAMPDGGRFTIETAVVDRPAAASVPDAKLGSYVSITVRDTGIGMDPETQARVFEPFFTTKEAGKGTGLGLSIVYEIVKQSNGHITVHSEPGRGTEFQIFLPAVLAGRAALAEETSARVAGRDETILVVEDEPSVRAATCDALRQGGYRVLVAAHADEAFDIGLQARPPVQLLLTDVIMPGLSGRELARQWLKLRPTTKVLYMSGYPEAANGVLLSDYNLIEKPFTAEQLLRRVRETLDRHALTVRTARF